MRGAGAPFIGWIEKPFDNESAEAVQIHDIGELNAIAEGAAGGENWVFEVNGANADLEVNFRGPWCACRLGRAHCR